MEPTPLQTGVEADLGRGTGRFGVFVMPLALLGAVAFLVRALGHVHTGSDGDSDDAIAQLRVRRTRGETADEKFDERASHIRSRR